MDSAVPLPSRRQASRRARQREGPLTVRPLSSKDFFGWHDAFSVYLAESGERLDETHALRVWQWLEASPARLEALLAESGGRVVGFVHFHEMMVPSTGATEFQLLDLFVQPEFRMQGASDELIGALYAEAERRRVSRICALTPGDDEASLRYWDRLGSRSGAVVHSMPTQARA